MTRPTTPPDRFTRATRAQLVHALQTLDRQHTENPTPEISRARSWAIHVAELRYPEAEAAVTAAYAAATGPDQVDYVAVLVANISDTDTTAPTCQECR